jgi:hypothetical protein
VLSHYGAPLASRILTGALESSFSDSDSEDDEEVGDLGSKTSEIEPDDKSGSLVRNL